jgi:hypothetical protein
MISETVAYAAMGIAGWAALQVIKIPSLEEKVDHCVERLDDLHDFLIGSGPDEGRGDSE